MTEQSSASDRPPDADQLVQQAAQLRHEAEVLVEESRRMYERANDLVEEARATRELAEGDGHLVQPPQEWNDLMGL